MDNLDCGHPPSDHGPHTTGYGIDPVTGARSCYQCCADKERVSMIETGRATLYLVLRTVPVSLGDTDGRPLADTIELRTNPKATVARWFVTDWPGLLKFKCFPGVRRNARGGGFGSQRTDAWFVGPDGYVWHAINRGDMDIARCKRTKVKA